MTVPRHEAPVPVVMDRPFADSLGYEQWANGAGFISSSMLSELKDTARSYEVPVVSPSELDSYKELSWSLVEVIRVASEVGYATRDSAVFCTSNDLFDQLSKDIFQPQDSHAHVDASEAAREKRGYILNGYYGLTEFNDVIAYETPESLRIAAERSFIWGRHGIHLIEGTIKAIVRTPEHTTIHSDKLASGLGGQCLANVLREANLLGVSRLSRREKIIGKFSKRYRLDRAFAGIKSDRIQAQLVSDTLAKYMINNVSIESTDAPADTE